MDYRVVIQPRAESDIAQAYKFIAQRAPEAAAKWYSQLKLEIGSLSKLPARCPIAPEAKNLGIELRQLLYGKRSGVYRIVFRIDKRDRVIHVLSVRHGARRRLQLSDLQD